MRRNGVAILFPLSVLAFYLAFQHPDYFVSRAFYRDNRLVPLVSETMPAPGCGGRIVIIAPHEDDEVLGCGGLISKAVASGAHVHIVLVTNGDYSGWMGIPALLHQRPDDYIRLGYRRQQESLAALGQLGIRPAAVTFLGYPNGPLYRMWLPAHWLPTSPAVSARTGCVRSPYDDAYSTHPLHCGQSLLDDLEKLLRDEIPDTVITTSTEDTNADHWATACFTEYALNELSARSEGFAQRARRYHYLVHMPGWPSPAGYAPGESLRPPCALSKRESVRWSSLELSGSEIDRKERSLARFSSQGGRFLTLPRSFIRRNELYAEEIPAVWERHCHRLQTAVFPDAPADSPETRRKPSGDIRQLVLTIDNGQLAVRLEMNGPVTRDVSYHLSFHAGGRTSGDRWIQERSSGLDVNTSELTIAGERLSHDNNTQGIQIRGSSLEICVPWKGVNERRRFLMVRAWTSSGQDIIDQTATSTIIFK